METKKPKKKKVLLESLIERLKVSCGCRDGVKFFASKKKSKARLKKDHPDLVKITD